MAMTRHDRQQYGTPQMRRLLQGRSPAEQAAVYDGFAAWSKLAKMTLSEDEGLRQFEAVLGKSYDAPAAVNVPHPLDPHDEIELARQLDVMTNARVDVPPPNRTYEQVDPSDPAGPVTAEEIELTRRLDALIGG